MAGTTGFHLNQNFFAGGSWAIDVLERQRLSELAQDGGSPVSTPENERQKRREADLGFDSTQKELHRAVYTFCQLVRSSKIDRPLSDHSLVEGFHELGQMNHRKCLGNLSTL